MAWGSTSVCWSTTDEESKSAKRAKSNGKEVISFSNESPFIFFQAGRFPKPKEPRIQKFKIVCNDKNPKQFRRQGKMEASENSEGKKYRPLRNGITQTKFLISVYSQ